MYITIYKHIYSLSHDIAYKLHSPKIKSNVSEQQQQQRMYHPSFLISSNGTPIGSTFKYKLAIAQTHRNGANTKYVLYVPKCIVKYDMTNGALNEATLLQKLIALRPIVLMLLLYISLQYTINTFKGMVSKNLRKQSKISTVLPMATFNNEIKNVTTNPSLIILSLPNCLFSINNDAMKLDGISIPSNKIKSRKVLFSIFGAVAGNIKKMPLNTNPANDAIVHSKHVYNR